MKKALLVIDMQEEYVKDYSMNFVDKINKKILQANAANEVIAYIKNKKISKNGNLIPEFAFRLEVISTNIFYKDKANVFSQDELNLWLAQNEIDTVEIIGAEVNNSIISSALEARKKGLNVILPCNFIGMEENIEEFNEKKIKLKKAGIKVITY